MGIRVEYQVELWARHILALNLKGAVVYLSGTVLLILPLPHQFLMPFEGWENVLLKVVSVPIQQ